MRGGRVAQMLRQKLARKYLPVSN